jgi:hypothetical protein
MRLLQVAIFIAGVVAFLGSAVFIGQGTGDTLWRTGVAAMLIDAIFMRLWPGKSPA